MQLETTPLRLTRSLAACLPLLLLLAAKPLLAADPPDLNVVHRIRTEALQNSRVMNHMFFLTDVYGPRLTNSPAFHQAAGWVAEQSREWGLKNVALEKWGPFGRGWSASRISAHQLTPQYSPLIAVPLSWSPGTDGVVRGTPILTPFEPDNDPEKFQQALDEFIARHKGKLRDQIILFRQSPTLEPHEQPAMRRLSASELSDRAEAREPLEPLEIDPDNFLIPEDPDLRRRFYSSAPQSLRDQLRDRRREIQRRLNEFLNDEGVRLLLYPARGDGGTLFPPTGGWAFEPGSVAPPPSVALGAEHYNRIARLIGKGQPAEIEVEVRARFHEETTDSINVVAELPGGVKADEVVIIGGHLDSWDPGTGATDNAAGCAVMMEVMRILKTLDLKMDRTVRLVLWGGEEQGLLGSRAYVKEHFADPGTMQLKPEHGKVAAYYNLDNGTGKVRGIFLQGNDMVRPQFTSWLAPFRDLGATTVSIRDTGGTDHLPFDAVGIPGFQFIQDPVEYGSRTHHSNMDVYDRIQSADLMQAAAVIASFVYHTANLPGLLPRKPLPEPSEVEPSKN